MAKSIEFSMDEMGELRSFYMKELSAAEDRVKNIRAILSKIGSAPAKRGRKPGKAAAAQTEAVPAAPRKRGRPAKAKPAADATPKKRGRKPKNAEVAVVATAPKRRGRPAKAKPVADAAPKKRGRKPKIQAAPAPAAAPKKRGRKPKAVAAPAAAPKKRGRKPKAVAAVTAPAKRGRKPKAVVVTPKAKPGRPKKEKAPKAPKAPKVTKKDQYSDAILKHLSDNKGYFSSETMVDIGIKTFKLKGKEKDAAKSVIQASLNRLAADGKILRGKKDKDRQAYWAALGTQDSSITKG